MSSLQITERKTVKGENEIIILDVEGALDAHTVAQMDEALSTLQKSAKVRLVVNFAKLEYISSAGMGLFVGWIDSYRNQNGDIIMVALKNNVLRVFKILGFDKIFKIFNSEEEALGKFS